MTQKPAMTKESDIKKELIRIWGRDNIKSIEYGSGGSQGLPDHFILNGNGQLAFVELKKIDKPNQSPKFRIGQKEELYNLRKNGILAYVLCLIVETQEISIGVVNQRTVRGKIHNSLKHEVVFLEEYKLGRNKLKVLLFDELTVYFNGKKIQSRKREISPHHKSRRTY